MTFTEAVSLLDKGHYKKMSRPEWQSGWRLKLDGSGGLVVVTPEGYVHNETIYSRYVLATDWEVE